MNNEIRIITHTSHETIISGDFSEGSLVIKFYTEGIAPPGTYEFTNEEHEKFSEICSKYLTELKEFVEENHERIARELDIGHDIGPEVVK